MTISTYLIIALIGLIVIFLLGFSLSFSHKKNSRYRKVVPWTLFVVIGLAALAPSVAKRYIYPKDKDVFGNADYHLLVHKGFNMRDTVYLVDSERYPLDAIYDGQTGRVLLSKGNDGVSLTAQSYYQPLFVQMPDRRGFVGKVLGKLGIGHEPQPQLLNRYYDSDCSEGLTITRNGETLLSLEIVCAKKFIFKDKEKKHYIIHSKPGMPGDTSEFSQTVHVGYSLLSIVASTPNLTLSDELRDLLDGASLVRLRPNGEMKHNELVLMPGPRMAADPSIAVNGQTGDMLQFFSLTMPSGASFTSGFGSMATKKMIVDTMANGCITLRYVMPDRKQLRKQSGTVLITSSVDVVANSLVDSASFDSQQGVYLYNIFDEEQNRNNIHAQMRYEEGDARTEINFAVHDFQASGGYNADTLLCPGTNFELSTRHSMPGVERGWVFQVEDMRATNKLTYSKIMMWFVGLFLLLVCARVVQSVYLARSRRHLLSLTLTEMAVYVVILAFGLTRLLLSWRSSTFVPLDSIGVNAFSTMRQSILFNTTLVCCMVPLLMVLLSFFPEGVFVQVRGHFSIWWRKRRHPSVWILGSFVFLMIICWLLGHIFSPRIFKILIPVLLYFYYDYHSALLLADEVSTLKGWLSSRFLAGGLLRPALLLVILAALFMFDAGFAVVFFIFSMLRLGVSLLTNEHRKWIPGLMLWVAILVLTFLFVLYEGWLMKSAMNHLKLLLPLSLLLVALLFAWLLFAWHRERAKWSKGIIVAGVALAAILFIPFFNNLTTGYVAKKGLHMKYRAEVQDLRKGEGIDKLMKACNFRSSDITFIMRSAQNQWFLNRYLYAGRHLDRYFQLQPHSAQGSPYNTQTTDIVVTRYVKAEHRGPIAEVMLLMLMLLIAIYCVEIDVRGPGCRRSRLPLAGLLLLFVTAFSVYTSATNRTVFMGQDFPFLSLQSKLAILLPCSLMLIAAVHAMRVLWASEERIGDAGRLNTFSSRKDKWMMPWLWISAGIGLFALVGWKMIPPKGADQSESQFDVSRIIDEVSLHIDELNESLLSLQDADVTLRRMSPEAVWDTFKVLSPTLWDNMSDTLKPQGQFFASLMTYFDQSQTDKCDADELIHIGRRNGVYSLRVNRKFYFIEDIIGHNNPWTGDILAAETPVIYGLRDVANPAKAIQRMAADGYRTNVLPRWLNDSLSSVRMMEFDSLWTPDHTPLVLLKTIRNDQHYYNLVGNDYETHGLKRDPQMATRLKDNDVVKLNRKAGRRGVKTFATFRYGREGSRYLAKNIWINGRRQLFYPLGKESMWSYQFANLVSNVYGDSSIADIGYRDRSLRVAIDYDLHKQMYETMSNENAYVMGRRHLRLTSDMVELFTGFLYENYAVKTNSNNSYGFYYDIAKSALVMRQQPSNSRENRMAKLVGMANAAMPGIRSRQHTVHDSITLDLAVARLLERNYAYSCVVIDGDGRIRLLFDMNKGGRTIDPNNIRHFNKFRSDMYRNGSNFEEREVLGNLALQHLRPGPGSTFKPIAYTAVTSTENLDWESLEMSSVVPADVIDTSTSINNNNARYLWYGGVPSSRAGIKSYSIDGGSSGLHHNDYIIQSNNRYHSMIILFGLQPVGSATRIIGPAEPGKEGFPQFSYQGALHSFLPEQWWQNRADLGKTIMETGLNVNFNINVDKTSDSRPWYNAYGNDPEIAILFNQEKYARYWAFPEAGSLRKDRRSLNPWMRNAFVQMVSGSYPLSISPLEMATLAMRLATLNAAKDITTLNDRPAPANRRWVDFDVESHGWASPQNYFDFYRRQVLAQMRQVPISGTAKVLKDYAGKLERQGLYLYAKTGTLNEDDSQRTRIRHLLAIVANKPLEQAKTLEELRSARYYVIYMTYRDVDKASENISNAKFKSQIETVVNSQLFQQYMFGN